MFTFRIRKGFRFSPPSNEEVTAESFRHGLERAVKITKLFGDDLRPPLDNVVGAQDYYAGKALHISGVSARDDELVLRLPRARAGPAVARGRLVLRRSGQDACRQRRPRGARPLRWAVLPRYAHPFTRGPSAEPELRRAAPAAPRCARDRVQRATAEAATRIENGTLDYFFESQQATLTPDTQAARAARSRYRVTPSNRIQYFAFNVDRPLFADVRMRRAVQVALDRRALVEASPSGTTALPATRLLHASILGYDEKQLYPLRSDLPTARRLAAGHTGRVVVCCTYVGDAQYAAAFNQALRQQLSAIGLRMTMLTASQRDSEAEASAKNERSDLIWGGLNEHTADPAEYLKDLILPPAEAKELSRVQTLLSPEREHAALALASRIERESLFAVYEMDGWPELVSRRLGCVVHQPEYAGVDLAALCLKR